jgi:hypothetical protein
MNQDDIRALALSLPEAEEHPHFDRASFRVRGKIFATLPPREKYGEDLVVLMIPPEIKESLLETDAGAVVSLGNWERPGVVQLATARMEPAKLADLVRASWRRVAPKKLQL